MPKTKWCLYAEDGLAPSRRKLTELVIRRQPCNPMRSAAADQDAPAVRALPGRCGMELRDAGNHRPCRSTFRCAVSSQTALGRRHPEHGHATRHSCRRQAIGCGLSLKCFETVILFDHSVQAPAYIQIGSRARMPSRFQRSLLSRWANTAGLCRSASRIWPREKSAGAQIYRCANLCVRDLHHGAHAIAAGALCCVHDRGTKPGG